MSVFSVFKNQVKNAEEKKTIVFPEGNDLRVLTAANKLNDEGLIKVILLGQTDKIADLAQAHDVQLKGIKIINPAAYSDLHHMDQELVKIMNGKINMTDGLQMLKSGSYFGTMLVKLGKADGMVSGAAHSTADTVRPALQIIKTAPGMSRVSGIMILEREQERYIFADIAMNIDPDSKTLAETAYEAAQVAQMAEMKPKIAFLSFSTAGSAKGEMVKKVQEAVKLFHAKHPDLAADGELQFDAALVPEIAKRKAPNSKIAGQANVFIFPELQSGNIGYKIAQRLGNFKAVGPILQGLAAPINDLSRGASSEDVYRMGILTAAQALRREDK